MRSRIILGTLAGAVAGFLAFAVQQMMHAEQTTPYGIKDPSTIWYYFLFLHFNAVAVIAVSVGGFLGFALGAVEGIVVGSPRRMLIGMMVGFVLGSLGGGIGLSFGNFVFNLLLFGQPMEALESRSDLFSFSQLVFARSFGWMCLGALLGLIIGVTNWSLRRAINGLIGGLIGGFLGGFFFEIVAKLMEPIMSSTIAMTSSQTSYEAGGPSRAVGFTLLGMLIGLFVNLIDEMSKQAWVRVMVGRNEGVDYIISRPLTILGRDERCDIGLYGDTGIAQQHAAIRNEGKRHTLIDGGSPVGTMVNGRPIREQLLQDGDLIQIASKRILFREKASAGLVKRPAEEIKNVPVSVAPPMPSNYCPYCGTQKDAQGNCLCTVPANSAAPISTGFKAANNAPTATAVAPVPVDPSNGPVSRLVGIGGSYTGVTFPLSSQKIEVGREAGKDIALIQDSTVSRKHATLALVGAGYVVYDEGSSNGTFVNGQRVTSQALAPGDIVQFGASKFRLE